MNDRARRDGAAENGRGERSASKWTWVVPLGLIAALIGRYFVSPVLSTDVVSFGAGLVGMDFPRFVLATALGTLPLTGG